MRLPFASEIPTWLSERAAAAPLAFSNRSRAARAVCHWASSGCAGLAACLLLAPSLPGCAAEDGPPFRAAAEEAAPPAGADAEG